jgi:hypothetical protein
MPFPINPYCAAFLWEEKDESVFVGKRNIYIEEQ